MAAAVAVTVVVLILFWIANPLRAPPLATPVGCVLYAVSLEPFVLIWLVAAIGNVARLRFVSPGDIAGGGLSAETGTAVRRAGAVLGNTLEQVVLALAAHIILAARLPADRLALCQALVILFCAGRLLFWLGYGGGAGRRALGFALTFYPSAAACLLSFAFMFGGGG